MNEDTLSQQFALIGLDGLDCLHPSMAKKAVLRGIAAAKLLEQSVLLPEGQEPEEAETVRDVLEADLKRIETMGKTALCAMEEEATKPLMASGALEETQDLLACDLNYDSAGVDIRAYRTDEKLYTGLIEYLRAEILEEGPVTAEAFCLIWLMRETGCLHDTFSVEEQTKLNARMIEAAGADPLYAVIWRLEFHNSLENIVGNFLRTKRSLFQNPYLEGINLLFPFLERRQAIFIDFVVFGTSVGSRRTAILTYLSERGHYVREIRFGNETLLKIDNNYYRIFPMTRVYNRIPVQGANLVPVYF